MKTNRISATNGNGAADAKPFLVQALSGKIPPRVPIWFMRQAGRYLPEYHEVRQNFDFMGMCRNVEASVAVSVQPFERFGLDGIIMFSDILTPLAGAGIGLHFEEKKGPVIETPVREENELRYLDGYDPERDTGFVGEIIRGIRQRIAELTPKRGDTMPPALLGFAGAPFTLASYLVEGGSTKTFALTKRSLFCHTAFYHKLADRLADITIDYLKMQFRAGVDAVQIFDSWGGILSPADYREFAQPYTTRIIKALHEFTDAPIILFVGNAAHLLTEMIEQEPNALSLDWRVSPAIAMRVIPPSIAIQGNLDPLILYGEPGCVRERTKRILEGFAGRAGYVFNLGHGIHPETPIPNVEAMVQTVREFQPYH